MSAVNFETIKYKFLGRIFLKLNTLFYNPLFHIIQYSRIKIIDYYNINISLLHK